MFNKKVKMEQIKSLRFTSKLSLKATCLFASGGDVEKASKLYDYFGKDVNLPDIDPIQPSTFDKVKDGIGGVFSWWKENQEDVGKIYELIQAFRGRGRMTPPIEPQEIPPLPPNE